MTTGKGALASMQIQRPSVLLISIDAVRPDLLFEAERLGVSIPNIQKHFIRGGTIAEKGVKGVFPTFTYPPHHSMITGTYPSKHGIHNNLLFDPGGLVHKGAWNWFVSENVPTLWKLAKENGYVVASACFPASACAQGDYIIPEFWRDGTIYDNKLLNAMSIPQGIVLEMEKELGMIPCGYNLEMQDDWKRLEVYSWLLEHKLKAHINSSPFFLSAYFASYDTTAHRHGVFSPEALETLEQLDEIVGRLIGKVTELVGDNYIVCLASDHGMLGNRFCLHPNVLFAQQGLIELDGDGKLKDWQVFSQRSGGTSEVRLKNPRDTAVYQQVKEILFGLLEDPENGLREVLTKEECVTVRKGYPNADFALIAQKGYELRDDCTGEYRTANINAAQHGYDENYPELKASFLLTGKEIPAGGKLGEIKLVDVAPTLAQLMGFEIPDADGENILFRAEN